MRQASGVPLIPGVRVPFHPEGWLHILPVEHERKIEIETRGRLGAAYTGAASVRKDRAEIGAVEEIVLHSNYRIARRVAAPGARVQKSDRPGT
jgi:hypothetical protein